MGRVRGQIVEGDVSVPAIPLLVNMHTRRIGGHHHRITYSDVVEAALMASGCF
jgi:hypothetical protein